MSEGEGFLSRWSRRKRATAGAPASVPVPPAPLPPAPLPPDATAPLGAERAFDPASLPPLESLTADSDFSAFLREEVPAILRRAALRRAWTLDPGIRDFVGPADYAWDFNAADGMAGFSLDLSGDIEQLLAQAIGSGGAEAEKRPGEGEAPPAVEAVASPDGPPPTEIAQAALPPPGPEDGAIAETLPAPAPAASAAELSPVRRRHGGALPS